MGTNNVTEYFKGKPVKTTEGAGVSPARGTVKKTDIYAASPNQLPAYGGDSVDAYAGGKSAAKSMKKPKGY